jgi:outer membrane protein assembly complex protein YaeT
MKRVFTERRRVIAVFALLLPLASARAQNPASTVAGPAEAAEAPKAAPTVVEVRLVSEDGKTLQTLPEIAVRPGAPLDSRQVADSLRTLYRTGDYADLKVVAVEVEGGVRLDFVARENLFFGEVRIEGLTPPPSEASAAAAMQLALGQTYRGGLLDEALSRMKDALLEDGLYQAEVSAETLPNADTRQIDIVVHVKQGLRARVGAVHLSNQTAHPDAELLAKSRLHVGRELTSARLQTATERIRQYLVKKGRLGARAVARRGDYDAAKNAVPLELEVTEGPRVRVEVTGAKFSKGQLKKLIPIYQEGAIDADLLEEGKRNIQEKLERDSYFDAVVDYTTETKAVAETKSETAESEQVITYQVERGVRHRLVGIEISGNHYFRTEDLKSRLLISANAFGVRGRFSQRLVDADAASMTNLYVSNGFLDAKVEAVKDHKYKGHEGDLFVQFKIEEGRQTRVASLAIDGAHAFKTEELLNVIGSTPGQPYSDITVATDRGNILALYFNEGFPEASFSATAEPAGTAPASSKTGATETVNIVKLTYRLEEGPQTRVRRVLLSGYRHTKPGAIRREVLVRPSEPLRQGDVVESQRRLYNLGIFNRVTIEPQNPAGTDPDKNIAVLVEEAKRYTLAYGGGFEVQRLASTTDPTGGQVQAAVRGILEITKNNLTGRADSLSLKLRGSTIEDRVLLAYSAPNTFANPHLSFQATAYTERTQDINTFKESRYEGSIQLTDQVTRLTTMLYRYSFRKVVLSNLNVHIAPDEVPLFDQPTLVSQFGVTWVRDSRNNPADATKGTLNSIDVSDADTTIGSSASFLRVILQNSTYHRIRKRFVFARSLRFGILQPYRDTVSLDFPPQDTQPPPRVIPLPERFFAGGGASLRGFALNQAGPRDSTTGFPVGGQAILVLNQEFRFPMRLPYIGADLGGALFYDGGNVYSRVSRISFRATLPRPTFATIPDPNNPTGPQITTCTAHCTNELNYFAHTIGFGLRYATPVGPIRVDLGYQINKPFFVVPCSNMTPNPTPACFKGTQLPRLQIFFNLGSTF